MNALPPFCDARVLDAPNHLGQPGTNISVFLAGRLVCVRVCSGRKHFSAPSHPGGKMIEFLAQMPTNTMIFITMAVLGLAATLIVLRRLI